MASSNFLKVPISPTLEKGVFSHDMPIWFELNKEASIAGWVLYFFERALWI